MDAAPASIHTLYAAARRQVAEAVPISVMDIDSTHTTLAVGHGPVADAVLQLDLGVQRTGQTYLRHTPPTPGEIENAIQAIEDEVARARSLVAAYPLLWMDAAALHEMAVLAGARGNTMAREAVEGLFNLLAALSQGRPARSASIPNTRDFATRLLVLREALHHLGFTAVHGAP